MRSVRRHSLFIVSVCALVVMFSMVCISAVSAYPAAVSAYQDFLKTISPKSDSRQDSVKSMQKTKLNKKNGG